VEEDKEKVEDEGNQLGVWHASEHEQQVRQRRMRLIGELEKQSDVGVVNVDELVHLYSGEYDQPVLMLTMDLQTQMGVYSNVVEELKKATTTEVVAKMLKQRYTELGLIPSENAWPNPDGGWLMNRALGKLQEFWLALRNIVARWRGPLAEELNLESTLAIGFQMSLGLTPAFTIVIQPEITL
jgi:hypothetical protein